MICSLQKEQYFWPGLSRKQKCSLSERLTSLPSSRLSCNELREIIPPALRPSDNLSPIFPYFHTRLYLQFFHFTEPASRLGHPGWTFSFIWSWNFQVGSLNNPSLAGCFSPHQICISSSESSVYLTLHSRASAVHLTLIRFRTTAGAEVTRRDQMCFFSESTMRVCAQG